MSEDFESEWKRYCDSKGDGAVTMNIKDVAKHFAQWQREQMMKDAISGFVVEMLNIDGGVAHKYVETDFLPSKEYEKGQEVKVIIIKE